MLSRKKKGQKEKKKERKCPPPIVSYICMLSLQLIKNLEGVGGVVLLEDMCSFWRSLGIIRGDVSLDVDFEVSNAHSRTSVCLCKLPVDQNVALGYFSSTMLACL